jgi:small subunit ribosomal protein S20
MANHKSALKRIKQDKVKALRNRYQHKSARTVIKNIRNSSDKKEASEMLVKVYQILDRLSKKNVIHKNKASNLKSSLTKHVNSL